MTPRPMLEGDIEADVCILGAGYSGLWSAYFLKSVNPSLKVVVLEAAMAGEGASGRNGGWFMGSFGGDTDYLAMLDGERRSRAKALITGTVAKGERLLASLGIDCDFHHGGNLHVAARYPQQLKRLTAELEHFRAAGFDEADIRWLEADEASAALNLPDTRAAIFTPHCARVQPLKLVRGLARAVEALGVELFEQSAAMAVSSKPGEHKVTTAHGSVKAPVLVSALEGYQRLLGLDGHTSLPVFSVLCATEPLSDAQWQNIGLDGRQTFADASRLITYGQRSQDGRLVFGARGGYGFGGAVKTRFGFQPRRIGEPPMGDIFDLRSELLSAFFPALKGVELTHGWGGCLALSRRFRPHAIFDSSTGLGFIGGYGGEGVGASMLFGETLASLIANPDSELAGMPWAYQGKITEILRRWESEPWPWLGYSSSGALYRAEERLLVSRPQSKLTAGVSKLADALEAFMSRTD
ncbi:FAD-binding oxidoreductase [Shewanella sp. JM162201]|uniref:FAD-binding oxidoreductase n=2 Tax=Shewanella jiangmenensis TaxID=2837387 RepID=A0ABS5V268_9GAMM|nr:FAD-binding oxidoreductase [Shewanella jiangmenensis]MBT1443716.1 FAD-binding oxidoreductase [Shewanella jiangmenensis]